MKNNFDLKKFLTENKLTTALMQKSGVNEDEAGKEVKTVSFPNGLTVTVGEPHPEEEGVVNFIRKGQNGYEIGFLDGDAGGSYAVDFNGEFLDEDDYIDEKKGTDHDPKEIKSVSFPNGLTVTVGEPHPEEEGIVNFIRKGEDGYEIGFEDGDAGGSYSVDSKGEFLDKDDDEGFATDIVKYIADTYIQNAKDGDKAYAEFRDLNILAAAFDVAGILQDRKHPLYGETKKEYQIVSRDKKRGLFEAKGGDNKKNKKMKNNFDLKKFLVENKLTANSRQIVNENQLPDATKPGKTFEAEV